MADLTAEFWQAAALTLTSWTFGVILFRMGCRDWQARFLSRALLALSPIVMTCFGFHAVRENQELAAIIAARKGESVDDRVYLASVVRSDCGDGYAVTVERYSDGTAKFAGQMPIAVGRDAWGDGGLQGRDEETWGVPRGVVPMPVRSESETSGNWVGAGRL